MSYRTVAYNVFRWYRAAWGRYTQADPVNIPGSSTSTYLYANAAPTRRVDPLGLYPCNAGDVACTCCKGGQAAVCVEDPTLEVRLKPPFLECMMEHENDHVDFVRRRFGDCPCKGAPEGGPYPLPGWRADMECRGYKRELDCLTRRGADAALRERRKRQLIGLARSNGYACEDMSGW